MNDQHWGPTISGDIVVTGGGSAGIGLLKGREWQTRLTKVD